MPGENITESMQIIAGEIQHLRYFRLKPGDSVPVKLGQGYIRAPLKAEGLLTRDPRMKERKKPGQRKARKRFQFSKR